MSFSSEIAKLVSDQLSRFVTLNRHQLAGQAANLDFWMSQVQHCMLVLDGYEKRFQLMKKAQQQHVSEHHTIEFDLDDPCCTQGTPAPPRKVPGSELNEARRILGEATRRFLVRCHREGLIDEAALRKACEHSGIGVDPAD